MVSDGLTEYVNADTRYEKSLVVYGIVEKVQISGGRFMKCSKGQWEQLSEQRSREKVAHAVRDAANIYAAKMKKEQQIGAPPSLFGVKHDTSHLKPPPNSIDAAGTFPDQPPSAILSQRITKKPATRKVVAKSERRQAPSSPFHLPADEALRSASDRLATLPNVKQAPNVQQGGTGIERASFTSQSLSQVDPTGGIMSMNPFPFPQSPINQQQRQFLNQMSVQPSSSLAYSQRQSFQGGFFDFLSPQQQMPLRHEGRGVNTTVDPMNFSSSSMLPQYQPMHLPPTVPFAPNTNFSTNSDVQQTPINPGMMLSNSSNSAATRGYPMFPRSVASLPLREPDMILLDPSSGVTRTNTTNQMDLFHSQQALLQQSLQQQPIHQRSVTMHEQQNPYYPLPYQQLLSHPGHQTGMPPLPGGRGDEHDHFMAAINAVLGPLHQESDDGLLENMNQDTTFSSNNPEQQELPTMQHQDSDLQEQNVRKTSNDDTSPKVDPRPS